jgi:hypothetical protein
MAAVFTGGCAKIALKKGQDAHTGKGDLAAPPAPSTAMSPGGQASAPQVLSVTGDWQFGFQFNNDTLQSTVHLDQQGDSFTGTGTDDQTKMPFSIEQGTISAGQVQFYKKYTSGNSPEIQYSGSLEMATDQNYKGPYMHGEYTTAKNGKVLSNIWEAEMTGGSTAAPSPASTPPPAPSAGSQHSSAPLSALPPMPDSNAQHKSKDLLSHIPELSGKWNCGYEYNFKTIHSTMFLEQDQDRITGHGIDHETHEKFIIDKGWYHFPKLTLIRTWSASKQTVKNAKGKGKHTVSVPQRSMIFKARVEQVSDNDYQGPYLSGKTQGGGNWEAQLYK